MPLHQPLFSTCEHVMLLVIVGGPSGSGSHTTSHEKQQPPQLRPSWSFPDESQDTNLSQQVDHPEHGLMSLSVHMVVQF